MNQITKGRLALKGSAKLCENPLPKLRARAFDKELKDVGLLESERVGFGHCTGQRLLPCREQDGYDRARTDLVLDTAVLENNLLRATFLPRYGGRLYSLFHKGQNRELLFANPVLQMANLAVRNAWFSGGVEWNLGQYGHSSLTAEPVYFARCSAPDGRKFLRMYEYERIKGLFLQLDFHLLENDDRLYVHAALTNPHGEARSFYWWTNTAAVLDDETRVLSGQNAVIATWPVDGQNVYLHDELPHLQMLPEDDGSYPTRFPFSAEYFYQNPPQPARVWEAACYGDGNVLYDRSTVTMPYRKMFCWSNAVGGRHWQELLSEPGAPLYVEIQSGVCPTQVHGRDLAAGGAVRFTQAFGTLGADAARTHDTDFSAACGYMGALVEQALPYARLAQLDAEFEALSALPPGELLFEGAGWALVEEARQKQDNPGAAAFCPPSMRFTLRPGSEEAAWLAFAETGALPAFQNGVPASFLTDSVWLARFEAAYKAAQTPETALHLALALYENGAFARAEAVLAAAAEAYDLPILWRTLAAAYDGGGQTEQARAAMSRAFSCAGAGAPDAAYYAESLDLLCRCGDYAAAWAQYTGAPQAVQDDERVRLKAAPAALELGEDAFLDELFRTQPATIREGEASLTELWFKQRAKAIARAQGLGPAEALQLARSETPPYNIDLRTN